jgi:hypothetical protein
MYHLELLPTSQEYLFKSRVEKYNSYKSKVIYMYFKKIKINFINTNTYFTSFKAKYGKTSEIGNFDISSESASSMSNFGALKIV